MFNLNKCSLNINPIKTTIHANIHYDITVPPILYNPVNQTMLKLHLLSIEYKRSSLWFKIRILLLNLNHKLLQLS